VENWLMASHYPRLAEAHQPIQSHWTFLRLVAFGSLRQDQPEPLQPHRLVVPASQLVPLAEPQVSQDRYRVTSANIPLTVNFRLDYFNTSSSKCVIDILDILDKYHGNSGKVSVKWYYKEDDDDMLETGEEFSSDIKVPFELLSYS
jgi:hypothetical protein